MNFLDFKVFKGREGERMAVPGGGRGGRRGGEMEKERIIKKEEKTD